MNKKDKMVVVLWNSGADPETWVDGDGDMWLRLAANSIYILPLD